MTELYDVTKSRHNFAQSRFTGGTKAKVSVNTSEVRKLLSLSQKCQ